MRPRRFAVVAAAVMLTACTSTQGPADAPPAPQGSTTGSNAGNAAPPSPGEAVRGVDPEPALLSWSPVSQPVDRTVVAGSGVEIGIAPDGSAAHLTGAQRRTITAPRGYVVSETLLDGDHAVVVMTDQQEVSPARALVLPLDGEPEWEIDGNADAPTTSGGAWALGQGRVHYASVTDGAYCLAEADLAAETTKVRWCAPESTGFANVEITPAGTTLLTFDDGRPSCRTPAWLPPTGDPVPLTGPEPCAGWDAVWLAGGSAGGGLAWTDVPNENDVGSSTLSVTDGATTLTLGSVLSGSLVWCAGAAYASQEQDGPAPARLLRWQPGAAPTVAYTAPRGETLISAPRCGGDQLTVSVLSTAGDRQVSALLYGG